MRGIRGKALCIEGDHETAGLNTEGVVRTERATSPPSETGGAVSSAPGRIPHFHAVAGVKRLTLAALATYATIGTASAVPQQVLDLSATVNIHANPVIIRESPGGKIGAFDHEFHEIAASGQMVVIDGDCISACTMALGIIPRGRLCATPRARLGFHMGWTPGPGGQHIASTQNTYPMSRYWPAYVWPWLQRHGGLQPSVIYMSAPDIYSVMPRCAAAANQRQKEAGERGKEGGHGLLSPQKTATVGLVSKK
jgi:hypothetical protein